MKKLGFLFCIFLIGCANNNEVYISKMGSIIRIESLKTISLGETDTITVTFGGGYNSCARPDYLVVDKSDNTISFKAFYKVPTSSQECNDVIPTHRLRHLFKPTSKGTYTYKSADTDVSTTTQVK